MTVSMVAWAPNVARNAEGVIPKNEVLRVIPGPRGGRFVLACRTHKNREEAMTRNNWIAFAILASATAIGACSPKGGQAGQTDRAAENQNQNQTSTGTDRGNTDRTARDRSNLPVSLTVPAGTKIDMTLNDELSSRKNKPGDTFTAKVAMDVRDASGNVVIDAGSTANGSLVAVKPAPNRRT